MAVRSSGDGYDRFALARHQQNFSAHSRAFEQAGWRLAAGDDLPVTVITHGSIATGWLLGWAILPGGGFADDGPELELPSPDDREAFEASLYRLAGRWLCIVTSGTARVYLDASGSLAAVYSPTRGQLVSTTTQLLDDPASRPERPNVLSNQWYPFGETSDPTAMRLLPNHYLDLETWGVVRHWPLAPIERVSESDTSGIADQIAIILAALNETFAALASRAPLVLPLTAGRDSRMLVATAREVIDRCEFVTFDYDDSRRSDVSFARAVARRLRLRHSVLALSQASDEQRSDYLHAIGYDASDGKARDFRVAAAAVEPDRGWITGFGGEVGRAYYWRRRGEVLGAEGLVRRMRLAVSAWRVAAASAWLESLPRGDGEYVLDLLYLEQRVGGWVSSQTYGTASFAFNIFPLNQRAVYEAMLRLPVEYRRNNIMARDIVASAWPELGRFPLGRAPGIGGRWDQVRTFALKVFERLRFYAQRLGAKRR